MYYQTFFEYTIQTNLIIDLILQVKTINFLLSFDFFKKNYIWEYNLGKSRKSDHKTKTNDLYLNKKNMNYKGGRKEGRRERRRERRN